MKATRNQLSITRATSNHPFAALRTTCARLLHLLLLLALAAAAWAADFTYTANSGTITITKYTGPGGDVAIPDVIDGLPVSGIQSYAFQSCTNLTSVFIPANVSNIRPYAFAGCAKLNVITVDALNASYSSADGVLFNKDQSWLIQCPGGKTESYRVPDTVTGFEPAAFKLCSELVNVTIGANMTAIGGYAFDSCFSLTNVIIPTSVSRIEDGAFIRCTNLVGITLPNSTAYIGKYVFQSCSNLTRVTIPISVSAIGDASFRDCVNLVSVTIPSSITSLGGSLFRGCSKLTSVLIPESVTSILSSTFASCTSLTAVHFQGDAPSLGSSVFGGSSSVIVYYLPGTSGWGDAFGSRPARPWNSPEFFTYMTNNSVVTITDYCGSGGAVTIPGSINDMPVTSIASYAFASSAGLTDLSIPSSITNIGCGVFRGCTNLGAITVHASNPCFSSVDGVLCNKDQTILFQCPGGKVGSYAIPDGIISIGEEAFASCTTLSSVAAGSSVTHIGNQAFDSCARVHRCFRWNGMGLWLAFGDDP